MVDIPKPRIGHMEVVLRRAQAAVTKKELYHPQIRAAIQQVRGE